MGHITVLAGTNGAGKSSIAGRMLRDKGGVYFNPDEETLVIRAAHSGMSLDEANGLAWKQSVDSLKAAISNPDADYTFETTLGGTTVTGLLLDAARAGHQLSIWYCCLDSPERHIDRVKARVAGGGHDIPEDKIRARYESSRINLVSLIPFLTNLEAYDNSVEGDPGDGQRPAPVRVLSITNKKVRLPLTSKDLSATPQWAKALVAAAMAMEAGGVVGGSK